MAEPCGTDHRLDASKMLLSVRNTYEEVTPVEGQTTSTFGSSEFSFPTFLARMSTGLQRPSLELTDDRRYQELFGQTTAGWPT
jgi:hypothetical protein